MAIYDLANRLDLKVPLIKINDQQHYLFGTDVIQPLIQGNLCVVRVGGGFTDLETHIIRTQEQHRRQIAKMMKGEESPARYGE